MTEQQRLNLIASLDDLSARCEEGAASVLDLRRVAIAVATTTPLDGTPLIAAFEAMNRALRGVQRGVNRYGRATIDAFGLKDADPNTPIQGS